MSKKNGHPKTEPFAMMTLSLIASAAWQSQSIHTRRLIDFLLIEHMRHAGKRNGFLAAPRQQLRLAGSHKDHISQAIKDAEYVGLIDCVRSKGRAPNRYALTWFPLPDGTEPSNRWKGCDRQANEVVELRKLRKTRLSRVRPRSPKKGSFRCQ
jgi:hypothetical protein